MCVCVRVGVCVGRVCGCGCVNVGLCLSVYIFGCVGVPYVPNDTVPPTLCVTFLCPIVLIIIVDDNSNLKTCVFV